jgi:hypothetical protein
LRYDECLFIVLSVKHAGDEALGQLEDLLVQLRRIDGLKEKRPGVFYHRSKAFLHFHEDPSGFFADLRCDGVFSRFEVTTAAQQKSLMARVRKGLSH